jgi:6-phosphogluconolactonase
MPRPANPIEIITKVAPTADEIAKLAADAFAQTVVQAVQARGIARVAVSGGSTPKAVFELLAGEPYLSVIPWPQLQLFWVDERCVPPTHEESNYRMTKAAMLDKVPLPAENVHRMEGELDPEEAASRYEATIRNAFRLEGAQTPTFDLIWLGLGPDGHTASLFPHTDGLHEMSRIVMANHVPQKDVWRITLTWPVIVQGREVAFLIEGEEKAEMVRTVWTGSYDPENWPAQMIRPASGKLTLMLDSAAAAQLPGPPAPGDSTLELP